MKMPDSVPDTFLCSCGIAEQTETAIDQLHEYLSIRALRLGRACERADVASGVAEGMR
mgnify:CR=1 FL=1